MKKGFSLIELSIVLVIIGILVAMSISLGTGQINITNIKSTQSKLERIDQAMALYLKTNGALPCPAAGSNAVGHIEFGVAVTAYSNLLQADGVTVLRKVFCPRISNTFTPADSSTNGKVVSGVVPIRSLGLSDDYAYDAWGNRITYVVSLYCLTPYLWSGNEINKCMRSSNDAYSSPVSGTNGSNIEIRSLANFFKNNAAYTLISHGKDGFGAWKRAASATRVPRTAATSDSEKENAHVDTAGAIDGAYDYIFRDGQINDGNVMAGGVFTNYFDDIVHWKSGAQVWDDAYINSALPPCISTSKQQMITQSIVTTAFGCQNGPNATPVIGTASTGAGNVADPVLNSVTDYWNYRRSSTGAGTAANPYVDQLEITSTVPVGAKYISATAVCGTTVHDSTAGSAFKIIFTDISNTEISSYYVCYHETAAVILGGGSVYETTYSAANIYVPIPENYAHIYTRAHWANQDVSIAVKAKWYFH